MFLKYFVLFLLLFLFACSSSPAPDDGSENSFAKDAIVIHYKSAKDLNMYDNEPHAIPLVVYQVNDINSFNMLKKDKAGIVKLLAAQSFDKSVMSVNKFFIAPKSSKKIVLDRAAKTKWVCLVAGFYDMQPSKSTLIYAIPDVSSWKFYESAEKQKFLEINLYFEKFSIEKRQE